MIPYKKALHHRRRQQFYEAIDCLPSKKIQESIEHSDNPVNEKDLLYRSEYNRICQREFNTEGFNNRPADMINEMSKDKHEEISPKLQLDKNKITLKNCQSNEYTSKIIQVILKELSRGNKFFQLFCQIGKQHKSPAQDKFNYIKRNFVTQYPKIKQSMNLQPTQKDFLFQFDTDNEIYYMKITMLSEGRSFEPQFAKEHISEDENLQ